MPTLVAEIPINARPPGEILAFPVVSVSARLFTLKSDPWAETAKLERSITAVARGRLGR
jgi:hypothetical protein